MTNDAIRSFTYTRVDSQIPLLCALLCCHVWIRRMLPSFWNGRSGTVVIFGCILFKDVDKRKDEDNVVLESPLGFSFRENNQEMLSAIKIGYWSQQRA